MFSNAPSVLSQFNKRLILLNSLYDIDFTQKYPIASQMFDKQQRNKWKRCDSSDSDSVELYDSAHDSDFRFSLRHKLSYDSDYDSQSDSVTNEKKP